MRKYVHNFLKYVEGFLTILKWLGMDLGVQEPPTYYTESYKTILVPSDTAKYKKCDVLQSLELNVISAIEQLIIRVHVFPAGFACDVGTLDHVVTLDRVTDGRTVRICVCVQILR